MKGIACPRATIFDPQNPPACLMSTTLDDSAGGVGVGGGDGGGGSGV